MKIFRYFYLFAIILSSFSIFTGCEDAKVYDGPQMSHFFKNKDIFYVSSEDAKYDIIVGTVKPATEDMNIILSVKKATDNGLRITIPGLNNGKVTIPLKKGETSATLRLTSKISDYSTQLDTLIFVVDNPINGEKVLLDTTIFLQSRRLCSLTSETLKANWDGATLEDFDDIGSYEMKVKYIAGDTLSITNFQGAGNTVKIKVDLSTIPYQTIMASNQHIWSHASYGRIFGQNTDNLRNPVRGILDECDGIITFKFGLSLPDYLTGTYWFTGYDVLNCTRK